MGKGREAGGGKGNLICNTIGWADDIFDFSNTDSDELYLYLLVEWLGD